MATYVYNCRDCQQFTEIVRPMAEEETIPVCDTCTKPMSRVYNSAPVQFKGTGFYKTGG